MQGNIGMVSEMSGSISLSDCVSDTFNLVDPLHGAVLSGNLYLRYEDTAGQRISCVGLRNFTAQESASGYSYTFTGGLHTFGKLLFQCQCRPVSAFSYPGVVYHGSSSVDSGVSLPVQGICSVAGSSVGFLYVEPKTAELSVCTGERCMVCAVYDDFCR